MKQNKIIKALGILTILAATAGISSAALAANKADSDFMGQRKGGPKTELSAEQQAEMEARRAEMTAMREAANAALASQDYTAWTAAIKAINENCPLLEKITSENFARFAEAHALRAQADGIMQELGIEKEGGRGFGPGKRGGMGMFGKGWTMAAANE